MIDLSKVPFDVLEAEYKQRKMQENVKRIKEFKASRNCKNCAYRIAGKYNNGIQQSGESWVCYKRPKKYTSSYFGRQPEYNQAYCVCGTQYIGCKNFLSIYSEEGEKMAKKLSKMSNRVID